MVTTAQKGTYHVAPRPTDIETLPMFPLGGVLLPGMLLPLHVFEPRYRSLTRDVLAADGRFGVVLIERGSEVGGGDVRTDVGTVAEVVSSEELADGRWLVVAVGRERLRVDQWLPDDPYPRARVRAWPDEAVTIDAGAVAAVRTRLERVLALAAELGHEVPDVDLPDDPVIASYHASVLAPVGPLDAQRLLSLPDAGRRLDLLDRLLAEQEDVLRFRLSAG
jgi:uncharacterized protein